MFLALGKALGVYHSSSLVVDGLISSDVLPFQEDAVCWDFHPCFNQNDVTHHDFRDEGWLRKPILAPDDGDLHVPHLVMEFEELLFFQVVARCCEESDEGNSEVN